MLDFDFLFVSIARTDTHSIKSLELLFEKKNTASARNIIPIINNIN